MLHETMTKPVDITYVKKHHSCFEPMVDCLFINYRLYGPRQANLVVIAYASSEGSGEPAHPRSLARTFATCLYKQ